MTKFAAPRPYADPEVTTNVNRRGCDYFFMQRSIVGELPHFAPSATPPAGQNIETSVSLPDAGRPGKMMASH
ncbi:hypothetical protein [Bradyrhizobium glycinis]|uniref:hypothetical protein n=1 Tax=Bradyrhizobium glycinis TaxID=2751812 RepID=UPI0018D7F7C7|nr:hypothetical protein [Bradyrhizobium glycinis]MBH5372792.1 hypothetical protein [Bradyrhizobium glycinis]